MDENGRKYRFRTGFMTAPLNSKMGNKVRNKFKNEKIQHNFRTKLTSKGQDSISCFAY